MEVKIFKFRMTKASKSNYATIQTPGPGSYTMNFKNNAVILVKIRNKEE